MPDPKQRTEQPWYTIRSRAAIEGTPTAAEVLIYGDIGDSWYGDSVAAKDFVEQIGALNVQQLFLRINSYGGSVSDGLAIFNAIRRHPAQTIVTIDGVAASIASLIAMAGDTVEMADNALMMIHAPWGAAIGNSVLMRQYADMLDTWAQAMADSYAVRSALTSQEIVAMLTDGKDHWFTAAEALDATLVDEVITAMPLAAQFRRDIAARYQSMPNGKEILAAAAAIPATPQQETIMPENKNTAAVEAAAEEDKNIQARGATEEAARAAGGAAEAARRDGIGKAFAKFEHFDGAAALRKACEADMACTVEKANAKLLDLIGEKSEPVGGAGMTMGRTGAEIFMADAENAIMARAGIRDHDGKQIRATENNQFRGHTLLDMARACLAMGGVSTAGMNKLGIVAAAFTQTTSDFPILLENTLHKTLLNAYALQRDTWKQFCAIGQVSDFRPQNRYRTGSIGNFDTVDESGEFKTIAIPDGEKESVTAVTKGNIINISRQMIINDDMGAFLGLATALGRSANRTIEAMVYALLASNSGYGPLMDSDGLTLFHAMHANLVDTGSGAAPSVTTLDTGRQTMAKQMDVGKNDYLSLVPDIWLGPLTLGASVKVINRAAYDPDTANKLQKPNAVENMFRNVVDSPRTKDDKAWYMFADPQEAPVVEVSFLDGMQEPFLEIQNGFDIDGAQYKARIDVAVDAVDYRGAFLNQGQ